MAYATQADALTYCGRINLTLSPTSTPSTNDVNQFLTDRSNQIDAALKSRGIAVPITDSVFAAELVSLNAKGAAADLLNAAFPMNQNTVAAALLREFSARINQYYQGLGVPTGIAVAEPDLAPASTWSGPYAQPARRIFPRGLFE